MPADRKFDAGRGMPPLSDGWVCTSPWVAEYKLLFSWISAPGVVMCDRHHDSAVDWSDLSDVSAKREKQKQTKETIENDEIITRIWVYVKRTVNGPNRKHSYTKENRVRRSALSRFESTERSKKKNKQLFYARRLRAMAHVRKRQLKLWLISLFTFRSDWNIFRRNILAFPWIFLNWMRGHCRLDFDANWKLFDAYCIMWVMKNRQNKNQNK